MGMAEGSVSVAKRLYNHLYNIAHGYMEPEDIMADAEASGLDYSEHLEMAYDNIRSEARSAINGLDGSKL